MKTATFDRPDGVQGWESDEKKLLDNFLCPKSGKVDFFRKLGLALGLGLGLGLAIQVVKMATFDRPDGVQGWESHEKKFLDNVMGPKCGKVDFFQKLVLA